MFPCLLIDDRYSRIPEGYATPVIHSPRSTAETNALLLHCSRAFRRGACSGSALPEAWEVYEGYAVTEGRWPNKRDT